MVYMCFFKNIVILWLPWFGVLTGIKAWLIFVRASIKNLQYPQNLIIAIRKMPEMVLMALL